MKRLFSPWWRLGGGVYVALIAGLATYAMTGDHPNAYLAMLILTLPAGYLMIWPIYLVAALVDTALGYGPSGSPVSLAIGVTGFALAGGINVVGLRLVALTVSAHRSGRQDPVTTPSP